MLSHILIIETMVNGERGINSVSMAVIDPRKEIGRPRDRTADPLFLDNVPFLTQLWGSAPYMGYEVT